MGVDALRGLSALAVLVCHIGAYWSFLSFPGKGLQLTEIGAHGVDVFIVLSGFCLALPLVGPERQLSTRQFLGRRAWRILPAYWVALGLAATLAIMPATWHLLVAEPATGWDLLTHIFGLQTVFVPTLGAINGSLWSVSLEMQLYLVFPIAVWLWRRWGSVPLLGVATLLAIGWDWLGGALTMSGPLEGFLGDHHALPARLVQFVAGMAMARIVVEGRAWTSWPGLVVGGLAGAAATLVTTLEAPQWLDSLAWGIAGALLIGVFSGPWVSARLLSGLEAFGRRSFSFYLLHQPLLLLASGAVALIPGGWPVQLLLGGVLVTALISLAAELLYRTVELPSHRSGRARFPSVVTRIAPPVPDSVVDADPEPAKA